MEVDSLRNQESGGRLTPTRARELCSVLERVGFEETRHRGGHACYQHEDGRRTEIPFHGDDEIGVDLLKRILRDVRLSRQEYLRLLREKT